MNAPLNDIPDPIDRLDRLISRRLDGEATGAERAELEALIATDPTAALRFDELQSIDAMAHAALSRDAASLRAHSTTHDASLGATDRFGAWRRGVAGAVVAAAAVVLFSIMIDGMPGAADRSGSPHKIVRNDIARELGGARPTPDVMTNAPVAMPQMIDYRDVNPLPLERRRTRDRQVIGVRDEERDVFYLFEIEKQSTTVTPVSGDI
jgi:hypothetical protein